MRADSPPAAGSTPIPRRLSRAVRVSEVSVQTTLPRHVAKQLFSLADQESSTIASITRRAIVHYVQAHNAPAGVNHG